MENFNYYNPAKIIFGKGTEKEIGKEIKLHQGSKVLVVTSGDFVKLTGIWDRVVSSFNSAGIAYVYFDKVSPNPKIEMIEEAVTIAKNENVDFVLAIGGGSSIDAAKAIALSMCNEGDLWDYFKNKRTATSALPIGVISTLPSSGSESSNAAIISFGEYKIGFESDIIIPTFAILNPELTLSLPKYQTACGLADIVCHLLERYFTQTEDVTFSDYLIEGALKSVMYNAQRIIEDPTNYNYRAEIMWSATVAHNNLLDAGRISDWASHRMEHELSSEYDITHGEGMAIVFPAWMRYMAVHKPEKLAQLANRLYGIDYNNYTMSEMANLLANKIENYFTSLELKTRLSLFSIGDSDFDKMARRATLNGETPVGHYLPVNIKEIIEIYHLMK